jgi:hypothetical protein
MCRCGQKSDRKRTSSETAGNFRVVPDADIHQESPRLVRDATVMTKSGPAEAAAASLRAPRGPANPWPLR